MTTRGRYLLGALVLALLGGAWSASAETYDEFSPREQRHWFAGVELGAMIPVYAMDDFVERGAGIALIPGYMFNDYFGLVGEAVFAGGKSKDLNDFVGMPSNDNITWIGGFGGGPRLALPLGDGYEIYGDVRLNVFTALADEAITGTSFGFSGGAGFNIPIGHTGWVFGPYARYYWLDQRVHGQGNAQFVMVGLAGAYHFREAPPPPPPPAPPPPPPPPPPITKKKIVPRAVYFDFDKSNIRPDARVTLDEAISILKSEPFNVVVCQGNTDSVGTEAYNMALSLRRARSVRDYLIKGGIPANKIKTEGFGETRPVASNATAEGRQQNRRVELVIQ